MAILVVLLGTIVVLGGVVAVARGSTLGGTVLVVFGLVVTSAWGIFV